MIAALAAVGLWVLGALGVLLAGMALTGLLVFCFAPEFEEARSAVLAVVVIIGGVCGLICMPWGFGNVIWSAIHAAH